MSEYTRKEAALPGQLSPLGQALGSAGVVGFLQHPFFHGGQRRETGVG